MTHSLRFTLVWLAVTAFAVTGAGLQTAAAQVMRGGTQPLDGDPAQGPLPNRLASSVGVTENLGANVSPDLTFLDEQGRTVRLGSLMTDERPVVLAFVYHSCPMLCSLVLDGVADAVREVDLPIGAEYSVLAVSMDPSDTPARADSAKTHYVEMTGKPESAQGMHFWTVPDGSEQNVKRLADEVGFRYARDVRTGDYAHTAVLVVLSPTGMISRYIYGMNYPPRDLRLALVEAGEGKTGTAVDRFILTCFHNDGTGYSLSILAIAKYIGGGLLALMVAFFSVVWRRELKRQEADTHLDDTLGDAAVPAR